MQCASLQQRGGSLKHLPKHPLKQKSSSVSRSEIARIILEPLRVIGHPVNAKAEVKRAGAERLSKEQGSRTLKMALLFHRPFILTLLHAIKAIQAVASYSLP